MVGASPSSVSSASTCVLMMPVVESFLNAEEASSHLATSALRSFSRALFFSSSVSVESPEKICSSLRVMKANVDNPSTMPDLGGMATLQRLIK